MLQSLICHIWFIYFILIISQILIFSELLFSCSKFTVINHQFCYVLLHVIVMKLLISEAVGRTIRQAKVTIYYDVYFVCFEVKVELLWSLDHCLFCHAKLYVAHFSKSINVINTTLGIPAHHDKMQLWDKGINSESYVFGVTHLFN